MIKREHYLKKIREFYHSDLIKIITGIRRCGKSVILNTIREELSLQSSNIIALDFEDFTVLSSIGTGLALIEYVEQHRQPGLCFVFLDEVQRLPGWADACRTLRLRDCSVFISGSNSKLLSGEFTKELSGRYVAFRIRPFVYQELSQYAAELNHPLTIEDYLVWGGFPKRLEFPSRQAMRAYLSDLYETIIINDVVARYKIRKTDIFRHFANFILTSNARIFSARSIHKYLNGNGQSCSLATITKYLGFLEEAYAIDGVRRYSQKAKRQLEYYRKTYNSDVALNSLHCLDNRYDVTHNLENIVYNELLYRDYSLEVFDNHGREIDFLAQKNGKKYYIQVAYSVTEEKAYTRELSAFAGLDNLSQKILITNDSFDYSTSTVRHIRLPEFLSTEEL